MAELSGFFNALNVNGAYDRKYNANDYSENLAVIISNGVLRSENDDLRVTASGMVVTVAAGRAWINGKWYRNTAPLSFAAPTPPAGGSRYDRIVLRYDNEVAGRKISARYVQGVAANEPVKPAPVRSGDIYEIVLADIFVGTNATSLTVTDTRADDTVCGWVYSVKGDEAFFKSLDAEFHSWFTATKDTVASVTLFKRYKWSTVLEAAASVVQFDIPQWDEETAFLDVYVNGLLSVEGVDYARSGKTLTFADSLVTGTEIEVRAYKSIDGTGILSVSDEITQLQNDVAAIYKTGDYEYHCNGIDDNVKLSQLAQAWLDGGDDYGVKTIRVYGAFGATAAYAGSGTSASPYRWISVGSDEEKKRRIVFDFTACEVLSFPIAAGTYNYIFYGNNAHIRGAFVNVYQNGAGTTVRVFNSAGGEVIAEDCRFWITAYQSSMIANTGTFTNCRATVANVTGNSYCFLPFNASLLRVNGGEFYAYTGSSTGAVCAVVGQSAQNAASILNGINCPTVERSGFYQMYSLYQTSVGGIMNCRDLVSELPTSVVSGISNISGTIAKSKPNVM